MLVSSALDYDLKAKLLLCLSLLAFLKRESKRFKAIHNPVLKGKTRSNRKHVKSYP